MDSELSSPGPRIFQGITQTPCDITAAGFQASMAIISQTQKQTYDGIIII